MDIIGMIATYVVLEDDVPDVGLLQAEVKIASEPILPDLRNICVEYRKHDFNRTEIGASTISYESLGEIARAYGGRINATVVLPRDYAEDKPVPYDSVNRQLVRMLPDIIREHEKRKEVLKKHGFYDSILEQRRAGK